MPALVVGPGIAHAMTRDGVRPASNEVYVHGNRPRAQWSVAMADNGTEYRWVASTGQVYRYVPRAAGTFQIMTRFGVAPDDLTAAIRAVFPEDQWINAAEVAFYESGWNPRTLADTVSTRGPCGTRYQLPDGQWATTEYSRGYFQINGCAYPQWNHDTLYAPLTNAQAAATLYQRRGNWGDWWISAGRLGLPRG